MEKKINDISSEFRLLSDNLLSTLNESLFFSELGKFLVKELSVDHVNVFKILHDGSSELIVKGSKAVKKGKKLPKGTGISGYVSRTKQAYFSNNVARDPLFAGDINSKVTSELCIPVLHEGVIISTLHFQVEDNSKKFSRDDITKVMSVLSQLIKPIENIKMYLVAKHLNEVLLEKIEKQEKELEEIENGLGMSGHVTVEEEEIVGNSEKIREIVELSDKAARTDANIVINGEVGTGKETLARRIHCRSSRVKGPFMVIDCSTLDEERLATELFGLETENSIINKRGAEGLLRKANGGTLVIRDVTCLSIRLQAKLSTFLKDGMAPRVGGNTFYKSNVRIVALTNKNLLEEVKNGKFYEDLFYSLNVLNIDLPSLRERKEDIELLASRFLREKNETLEQKSLSPGAVKLLSSYDWPGNIRELYNTIARANVLADSVIIEAKHLPENVKDNNGAETDKDNKNDMSGDFADMTLGDLEKRHICRMLQHFSGNKTKSAKALGITVKTLYNKLNNYGSSVFENRVTQ